ncbi:MAG: hypothetical protein QOI25_665 [Mycobacterium sp.]|nr:hypothetical protein [Mycobacterium sp.]
MELTVTFVGNATTLISAGGITVLTDPNFLHRGSARTSDMVWFPNACRIRH